MTSGLLLTVLGSEKDTAFINVNLFNKMNLIKKYILTFSDEQDANPEKLE